MLAGVKRSGLVLSFLISLSCTHTQAPVTSTSRDSVDRTPAQFWGGPRGAQALSFDEILKLGAGPLQFSRAQIITNNDHAFWTKYDMIQDAKPGETVRMVYYIWNPDHSSSYLTQAILGKAKQGVKFKILLDLMTNYIYLDEYRALEQASNGNIQFRFFGVPSQLIMRDLRFMTTSCGGNRAGCSARKVQQANLPFNRDDQFFASSLMSGIWSRNTSLLKMAVLFGQETDPKDLKAGSGEPSEAEMEQLKELLKTVFDAAVKGDPMARIKLAMAATLYASEAGPILNLLYSSLPLELMAGSGNSSVKDWTHLTDWTHHKLLLVGTRLMTNGGRNIENSYHMRPNSLTGKYNFIDVDFSGVLQSGGEKVAQSFDQLYNFGPMTLSTKAVYENFPNDLLMNKDLLSKAVDKCWAKLRNRSESKKCILQETEGNPAFQNSSARLAAVLQSSEAKANEYQQKYVTQVLAAELGANWKKKIYDSGISFTSDDLKNMQTSYVENLHFTKADPKTRTYSVVDGEETASGKNIHALWVKGLENSCAQAKATGKPVDVYLYQAYWLPTANLMRAFAQMIDGTWDCAGVRVKILTNSFETTDLNVINVLARYQTRALFEVWANREQTFGPNASKTAATFEYFEYNQIPGAAEGKKISLHTKVMVFGDDLVLGSANMDPRSYVMDTNNAVYIRGAQKTAKAFKDHINNIINNKTPVKVASATNRYLGSEMSVESLKRSDALFVEKLIKRFDKSGRINEARKKMILDQLSELTDFSYSLTKKIYSVPNQDHPNMVLDREGVASRAYFERLESQKRFNEFLMLL